MIASNLRAVNRSRVLDAIMSADTSLRPELAQKLGLSLMSVTRIVRELMDVGLVQEGSLTPRSEPGRPARELSVNPSAAFVLGFEMHAFRQSMALMDLSGRIVRTTDFALSMATDGPFSLREIAKQAKADIRATGIDPRRIMAAAVAMTGVIDREAGIVINSPYLGWRSLDIVSVLRDLLDIPVIVDRIASILLAAEARTVPELRDAILVNIGFAMSAGILVNGTIAYGHQLLAGQIGHLGSDDQQYLCPCGQRGCLNVAASGWSALADVGLLEDVVLSAEEFQRDRPKLMQLLQLEERGDAVACQALQKAGRTLGRTIKPLQIALDPQRIFLAGPVGRIASYVEGVRDGIGPDHAALIAPCKFKVEDAAALVAFEQFIRSPRLDFGRLSKARRRRKAK